MSKNKKNVILKIKLKPLLPRIHYSMPPTGYLFKSRKKYYRVRDKRINCKIDG